MGLRVSGHMDPTVSCLLGTSRPQHRHRIPQGVGTKTVVVKRQQSCEEPFRGLMLVWLAVKEHILSYYIGENIVMTIHIYINIYAHSGNLTKVP